MKAGYLSSAFFAAALLASPAPAQSGGKRSAAPPKTREKLICQRTQDTGRLVPSRKCKTQAEWDRQADRASQAGQNWQDAGAVTSCSAGPACARGG